MRGNLVWSVRICICDQKNRSNKRGGLSRGWSLKGGTAVQSNLFTATPLVPPQHAAITKLLCIPVHLCIVPNMCAVVERVMLCQLTL